MSSNKVFHKMLFGLKSSQFSRISITSRTYCEEKSIYQRNEEGKKPRTVHGKLYPEWRKPWIQRDGEWYSNLSVFTEKNPSPYIMNALNKLPNLSMQDLRDWWSSMKVIQQIQNQKYLPERVAALGSNLAALHFFTYRQALVRLKGSNDWMSGDIVKMDLPDVYTEGYLVEGVDCTKFHHDGIRFEGLQNLNGLNFLKWLSLRNNKHVDVWCLDRIAGQNSKSLEYLDITGCNLDVGGVFALANMVALKTVIITDPRDNLPLQAALSILEQEKPDLLIKAVAEPEFIGASV